MMDSYPPRPSITLMFAESRWPNDIYVTTSFTPIFPSRDRAEYHLVS